jgi:glycosyltransferase involved in cell wall biosynthesis
MRILLTVHQFLPDHASGTEILTLHTAQELQRRGHEVSVFTGYPAKVPLRDDQRFDSYVYEGITVHRFLHQHMPMGGQTNIVEMEYRNDLFGDHLRDFLARNPQDVVHFFHLARLTATAIDACVEAGIPTVFTTTDFWTLCPMTQLRLTDGSLCEGPGAYGANCVKHVAEASGMEPIASRLRVVPTAAVAAGVIAVQNGLWPERWYSPMVRATAGRPEYVRHRVNKIDRVLVPTHLMHKLLTKNGIHPSRLAYVPYGIDFRHMRRDVNKGTGEKLRIGFVGTLYEHKGAHLLVQAMRSLAAEIPAELIVYGKLQEFPAYVERLRQLAGDDPRITFAGTFPNAQIGRVFAEMDVLVVPSIWYENTPLVIYSAMAAGCPVVATNLGGMSEAVTHEVNGLLFEKGDVGALAGHLERLALDRALVRRLSMRTRIPKSIPQNVDELESIYRSVVGERLGASVVGE